MGSVRIEWDKRALGRFIGNCEEGRAVGQEVADEMAAQANLLADDPTYGRYGGYPDGGILTHPQVPEYEAQMVEGRSGFSWIAFVHSANGAAAADAVKNNTLAKVL